MTDHSVSDVGGGARAGDDRWYLNDQRDFLLRSIADAHSEHDAGDLSDADFSLLVARDRRRLADVELALGELAPSSTSDLHHHLARRTRHRVDRRPLRPMLPRCRAGDSSAFCRAVP